MSNRRRLKPRRDAIMYELARASACDACGSTKVLRRWRQGAWELTPLHRETCPTRRVNGRKASPHRVSENAVAGAQQAGYRVAYMPFTDGSGGVVVDAERDAVALS